ncbi:MAG TPA: hypothetical protein VJR25_11795 [Microbacterium sp.]|uniref:lipopolysaccharide biosynthesis protein n=1 Tax=Microbacterium sp. TaxID=51671 RepID=UPI002B467AF3|nr:hypothetical protein [Microbacterium sp.]HKT57443.1 hypothetical protein [Microbacterium sp.]
MKRSALSAILAQGVQAGISFVLQLLVVRALGLSEYGRFAVMYGILVLASGIVTGLVGDSLVALERDRRDIRAGLLGTMLIAAVGSATISSGILLVTGFIDWPEAIAFAVAVAFFVIEEVFRRLLGANMKFHRILVIDSAGFVVALAVLGVALLLHGLSLAVFFAAIGAGQIFATLLGAVLVPKADRWMPGLWPGSYGAVFGYGTWRALVQTLRPGMFTGVRLLVAAFVGLAAVGGLEAARTYTSPLLLVVGGLSSFLFVRFAHQAKSQGAGSLHEADRVSRALLLATAVLGGLAVAVAPWIGPLLFGVHLDLVATAAWAVYGVSVAVVTPYGALSAVSGMQTPVFFIRLGDTLLGLVVTVGMLLLHIAPPYLPFGLAVASALGGFGLRWLSRRVKAKNRLPEPSVDFTE